VIIKALKEEERGVNIIPELRQEQDKYSILDNNREFGPNHQIPGKPIDKLNLKVEKLSLDIQALKRDMRIVIDHINSMDKLKNKSSGWFY
jgi:hypothetical protein